jgi:hypothetical protein
VAKLEASPFLFGTFSSIRDSFFIVKFHFAPTAKDSVLHELIEKFGVDRRL